MTKRKTPKIDQPREPTTVMEWLATEGAVSRSVMASGAAIATVPFLIWAVTGAPENSPWVVAFAGITCGFCWGLVYARRAIERSGL
jgi:hypothetical protein